MGVHTLNTSILEAGAGGLLEFKASLVEIASYRTAETATRETVFQRTNKQNDVEAGVIAQRSIALPGCSCKGPWLSSQHLHCCSQPSATLVPRDPTLSFKHPWVPGTCMVHRHTYIHVSETFMHMKINLEN